MVALSGGHSRDQANKKLAENQQMIASFSRALTQGLLVNQNQQVFSQNLQNSIDSIFKASIN